MPIDKMKKLTLLCQVAESQRLMRTLHGLGIVEVTNVFEQHEAARESLERQEVSTEESDHELQRINLMLGLIDALAPEKKGFVAGLAPVPLLIDPKELDEVRQNFDIEGQYAVAHELDAAYRRAERNISDVENKLKDLRPFEDLPIRVGDLARPARVRILFGAIPAPNLEALAKDPNTPKTLAFEQVFAGSHYRKDGAPAAAQKDNAKATSRVLVAFPIEDQESARKALAAHGFEEITLPQVSGTVRDRIRELESDRQSLDAQTAEIKAKVAELAQHRRSLLVLKAFWESGKNLTIARTNSARGRWVQVVTGYIREVDVPRLQEALREHDRTSMIVEDPAPGEAVPVYIKLPPVIRPIQMLVDLFGLPAYNTFDPSPFIFTTFLLFFGICFSDVAYGTMLVALSLYIMSKTKAFVGVYNFARLLFYAGISTIIFGFLLGSWFGDLYMPQYLGENNIMYRIMTATQVIDPLEKPIVVLLCALAIGMLNQFYGIALKMYSALLRGDKKEAYYDGLLWLITLPGFIVIIAGMFVPVPPLVSKIGLIVFAFGAIGLILTQGRDSAGWGGRIITGIISLYGIVGSYGLTAFIGDTMSYCRLLALALTTGIVALSFNMMADLLRPIPYVGIFLFVGVLIVAHIFNFLISVLGAFVHSMRLIFVEFFGRFYATGSRPFSPLSFDTRTAILKKD